MLTIVSIDWDTPEEEHWLCPENIKLALEACCSNTKFKVKKVEVIPMLTKFSSVDDLIGELETTKFPFVGLPHAWTFGGLVARSRNNPDILIIKNKEYPIVANIKERCVYIIAI